MLLNIQMFIRLMSSVDYPFIIYFTYISILYEIAVSGKMILYNYTKSARSVSIV